VDDTQRLRYSRHLLLNEFGEEAQERLLGAHALVIGAGGLGSSALLYLASSGIGQITICDGDRVELTNLQRQVVHRHASIGRPKATSAAATLMEINPDVRIEALVERAGPDRLLALARSADVVLDCSDNFATRHALNRACVASRRPLVSGAGIRFDGQVAVFDLRREDAPCYHCLFPESGEVNEERCATMGVFAPLVGVIGTLQAMEAIKLVAGVGETLSGRLLLFDALGTRWHEVRLGRDPHCAACAPARAAAQEKSMKLPFAVLSVAAAMALLPGEACAQTLYKLIDKNGKVTYVEKVPDNFDGKVIPMKVDPKANTATLPKPSTASPSPAPGSAPASKGERVAKAKESLESAKKALAYARDNPGEEDIQRMGSVKGGARPVPTESYKAKLEKLEAAVKAAEKELEEAERGS
jgi:adenylyltransferase/sulfurtransferase